MGSSEQSAIWAGELGLRYAFADFINPGGAEIVRLYRERFSPVRDLQSPRIAVAAWVLVAPTDEEALELAASSRMAFTLLRRGQLIAVPPPAKALEFLAREGQPPGGAPRGRRTIVGSPEKVRAELETLAADYQADEVIVVTITYDHEARRRSYELLADAMGLEPRSARGGRELTAQPGGERPSRTRMLLDLLGLDGSIGREPDRAVLLLVAQLAAVSYSWARRPRSLLPARHPRDARMPGRPRRAAPGPEPE